MKELLGPNRPAAAGGDRETAAPLLKARTEQVRLTASPERLVLLLAAAIGGAAALGILARISADLLGHRRVFGLVPISSRLFTLGGEADFMTWVASTLFLLCALIAIVVSVSEQGRARWSWGLVAAVLAYLSADETGQIHEAIFDGGRVLTGVAGIQKPDGTLRYLEQIIGLGMVGATGLVLLGWLVSLPRRTMALLIASGVCFVGGAVGMEIISLSTYSTYYPQSWLRFVLVTLEEGLELGGQLIALYALLDYLRQRMHRQTFRLELGYR